MRIQNEGRLAPGRIGVLLAVAMLAALLGVGLQQARPAYATGCTFRLALNGVNGADYNATEGEGFGGGFNIVVEKLTPSCVGGVVLTLTPGTAGTPGDYDDIGSFGLPFQAGETTRSLNIFPNDDVVNAEPPETFTVTITAQAGDFVTAPTSQVLTILDNDGPPSFAFSASNYNVTEGTANIQITVNRAGAVGQAVTVSYTVSNGTATSPGDFTAAGPTVLNFSAAETSETFNVTIANDGIAEGSETVNLTLSSPSNGGSVGAGATITITDNDGAGVLQFSSATYNVTEGAGSASITVTRTGGSTGFVTVNCNYSAGSATNGVDFTAGSQLLSFADGNSQTCTVPILNDGTPENQETVNLSLSGGSGTVGAQSLATLFINDDDGSGNVAFSSAQYFTAENGGGILITVNRLSGSGSGSVTYNATTGAVPSATAGVDFTAASGVLSWDVNELGPKTFTVFPLDDPFIEGSENVSLTLSNPTGSFTLGSPSSATLTITDNESAGPVITSILPSSGTILGGTPVTISGVNLLGAFSVTFDGVQCTNIVVLSTTITCNTPAHVAGTVQVVVTTPSGVSSTATTANDFTYTGGPTVTSINPTTGSTSGNTIVTIIGTGFTPTGTTVRFGGTLAVHTFLDSQTLVAVAPAHSAGVADVIVTTPGGSSPNTAADDFTYTGVNVPIVTSILPTSGGTGALLTITGSGFSGATGVTVGGVAATFTVNSDGQITATVPFSTPLGVVDVRVTTPQGTSANTVADNFTNTSSGQLITYTLYFRFTLIVWTGPNGISALAALRGLESPDNPATNDVSHLVGAIWRFDGPTQTFKGYFPGSDGVPGANDFTTLTNGVGYFVALLNPGTVTWTTLR